jgi:outer membrane protein assembly factor BamD
MRRLFQLLLVIPLATVLLAGCSLLPEKIDETKSWSVQRLVQRSQGFHERRQLPDRHRVSGQDSGSLSVWPLCPAGPARHRLLQYKDNEPDAAIAAADRFIKANPRHPYVDYAYYMKGLANFQRSNTLFDRLAPIDRAKTDTNTARQAYNDFSELVRKFPNSKYAEDARPAGFVPAQQPGAYEVNVADYYLRRGAYVAAVNRAKYVLENLCAHSGHRECAQHHDSSLCQDGDAATGR